MTEGESGGKQVYLTLPACCHQKNKATAFLDDPATWANPRSPSLAPCSWGDVCSLPNDEAQTEQHSCLISGPRTPSQILCLPTISSL